MHFEIMTIIQKGTSTSHLLSGGTSKIDKKEKPSAIVEAPRVNNRHCLGIPLAFQRCETFETTTIDAK